MYALVLTLFFSSTTEVGVNKFKQTVLTKTESMYFTKEECEYLQESIVGEMRNNFLKKKASGDDVVQLSLTCSSVSTLTENNIGVIPIPEKRKEIRKEKFNFNGATNL